MGINDGGWRSESGEKMDLCYLKAKSKPCKLAVSRCVQLLVDGKDCLAKGAIEYVENGE